MSVRIITLHEALNMIKQTKARRWYHRGVSPNLGCPLTLQVGVVIGIIIMRVVEIGLETLVVVVVVMVMVAHVAVHTGLLLLMI